MSFLRKTAIALGATAAVAGGAGAYVYFNGLPGSGSGAGLYGSAQIVPDDAVMAIALGNNTKAWQTLGQFGSAETQAQVDGQLQNFQQSLLEDTGLSLEEDILPLLESVLLALLPPTSVDSADAPEVLAVISTTNPVKALGLLTKVEQGEETKIAVTEHQGVQLTEITRSDGQQLFSAILDQRLVISPLRRPVEMAIETAQGEPSLADSPQAAAALKGGDADALARLYIPDYGDLVTQLINFSPDAAPLSPEALAQLDKVNSVQAGLTVEPEGLRLRAMTQLDSSLRPDDYQSGPSRAVERFPAETVAFFSGQGVSQYWGEINQQAETLPESAMVFDLMRNAVASVDIDLDRDVFGWMTGEFAFGILPVNQGLVGQVGMGAVLVLDSGDRPTTEALFGKLDKLVSDNQLKVDQKTIGKTEVTAWVPPLGTNEALVGRGWIAPDSLFIATGEPLVQAMAAAPAQALPSNPVFQSVMAQLPKNGGGYGFVNVEQALSLVANSPLSGQVNPQGMEALKMVEGIGMISLWDKPETSEFELFISLKSQAEMEAALP